MLHSVEDFEELAQQYWVNEPDCASIDDAREALEARHHMVMSAGEAEVLAMLRRHWDAFTLLFNPSINL